MVQPLEAELRAHVVRIDRKRALQFRFAAGDVAGLRERAAKRSRHIGGLREKRLGLLQRGQRVFRLLVVAERPGHP